MEHPHLSATQKGVLHALIGSCDWATWKATISNARLAQYAGVTPKTIQRAMNGYGKTPGLVNGHGIVGRWHNRRDGSEHASTFTINVNALANLVGVAKRGASIGVDNAMTVADLREASKVSTLRRISDEAWAAQPELVEMWVEHQVPDGLRVP